MKFFTKCVLLLFTFIVVAQANIQPLASSYDIRLSGYGARYYDPRTSVWQSPDPIIGKYFNGGKIFNPVYLKMYTYTGNNPINMIDPDGRELMEAHEWAPMTSQHSSGVNVNMDAVSIGVDFIPVVGNAKSIQETATGENLVTGDNLSDSDRTIAGAGILLGGYGKTIAKAFKGAGEKFKSLFGKKSPNVFHSIDDIANDPLTLWGKTADEVGELLGSSWTKGKYGSKKTGWKFTKDDKSIFFHPGKGRHKGSYYGFSSTDVGKNKIVDSSYVPTDNDKANIIYIKDLK